MLTILPSPVDGDHHPPSSRYSCSMTQRLRMLHARCLREPWVVQHREFASSPSPLQHWAHRSKTVMGLARPGYQSAIARNACLSTGLLWRNNACCHAERRKIDKDARACTAKDAYAFAFGSGNGLIVEMLRRTAPRIMPRRLIVVAEARLQAQIHKQAEQNKVRHRLSQTRITSFVPTLLHTTSFRLPSTGSRNRKHRLRPPCRRTIRWGSLPHCW